MLVGNRDAEAGAELGQLLLVELFLLMRHIAAFAGFTQAIALDRVRQDHGRRTLVGDGRRIGGIDLFRVMPAARELAELLVRKMFHQAARLRVFAEEMLANVRSGLHSILHELAVADLVHALDEQAAPVLGQEPVPVASPDDLDDVPAGAPEGGLDRKSVV